MLAALPDGDAGVGPVEVRANARTPSSTGSTGPTRSWPSTFLGSRLESPAIPFTVSEISRRVDEPALLTDRRATLLRTAVERGSDDTPRNCTPTELTDHVGVAESTCSGTLHRAESRVVRRVVGDGPVLDAHRSDRPRSAPTGPTDENPPVGWPTPAVRGAVTGDYRTPRRGPTAGSGPDLAGTGGS